MYSGFDLVSVLLSWFSLETHYIQPIFCITSWLYFNVFVFRWRKEISGVDPWHRTFVGDPTAMAKWTFQLSRQLPPHNYRSPTHWLKDMKCISKKDLPTWTGSSKIASLAFGWQGRFPENKKTVLVAPKSSKSPFQSLALSPLELCVKKEIMLEASCWVVTKNKPTRRARDSMCLPTSTVVCGNKCAQILSPLIFFV